MLTSNGSRRRRVLRAVLALVLAGGALAAAAPAHGAPAASAAPAGVVGGSDLGPNVYLFTPDMPQSEIQSTVDSIAAQQVPNQFGTQRYALLFAPGTYGSASDPLVFQVGYYTDVAGLGQSPGDVVINGEVNVYNQCDDTGSCTALNNFWRSVSNLTINVTAANTDCDQTNEFWATSQAASMRRVQINGTTTLFDYCSNPGYASGGFIADSAFSGQVINGSQQQYVARNSNLGGGWSNSVWNQVFVGDTGAPAEDFGTSSGNAYTTVAATPIEQEKPYLYLDAGVLKVFVPSSATDTTGTTWQQGATPGTSLPMSSFYVASPSATSAQLNKALTAGKNLLLTPGVYQLSSALNVNQHGTVVLGLGLATLVPTNGNVTMHVAGVPGVKISDVIFDAGPITSPALLSMAASRRIGDSSGADPAAPTLLQDVYFRIGGATAGSVVNAAVIKTSNVVLDNVWAWRADHGNGVGWAQNTARTGLQVTGADVTAYGLFVEHFQGNEVVWNGPRGSIYMFQNEMPYDVPSQRAWNSGKKFLGYPAIVVRPGGTGFRGYGLGSYSFFNQGVDIHATQAFTTTPGADESLHDVLTRYLNGAGGIDSVINGNGAAVNAANPGPTYVIDG